MPLVYSSLPLHPQARNLLEQHANLVVGTALDVDTQLREARNADVVIVRAPLPAALFDMAPQLRCAIRHGSGIDMIPYEEATAAGILIANVPGANARTVAEHVFMVSLALSRQFRRVDQDLRTQSWMSGRSHADTNIELGGRTIGIVGFGNIGSEIARIAQHGFHMKVLAHSRSPRIAAGISFVDLDALLETADIVVLCCPLTVETRGLIDQRRLALMKHQAMLVNVSRGPVIVEQALIETLAQGRLRGAALDVFNEQPLPADHPFFSFGNVILTPHMAGITDESMMRMGIGAVEQALEVLRGGVPANLRNPEALHRYRQRFGGSAAE